MVDNDCSALCVNPFRALLSTNSVFPLARAVYRDVFCDLFQTPGFGDTIDFEQIKQHYYGVHTEINPTGIVPKGPDLSGWLTEHGRESLGGRPFGTGTPPGPPPAGEQVPPLT